MLTSAGGAGAAGADGACDTADTTGPEGEGFGVPAAGGALVVTTVGCFCPAAGGCTTEVVVMPSLSTLTTCCGWPVATACCFACCSAFSCFDAHPKMPVDRTTASAHTTPLRIHKFARSIFVYPSLSMNWSNGNWVDCT